MKNYTAPFNYIDKPPKLPELVSTCRHCQARISLKYPLEQEGRIWVDEIGFSICNTRPPQAHEPLAVRFS